MIYWRMQSITKIIVLVAGKCNMSIENRWNNNDWGKPQYLKKNRTQCDFRMWHQLFAFTEHGITTLKTIFTQVKAYRILQDKKTKHPLISANSFLVAIFHLKNKLEILGKFQSMKSHFAGLRMNEWMNEWICICKLNKITNNLHISLHYYMLNLNYKFLILVQMKKTVIILFMFFWLLCLHVI
jgi:hypothetical protein